MSDDDQGDSPSNGGIAGVVANLEAMLGKPPVATAMMVVGGVMAVLGPVVAKAVAESLRDPEVQERLAACGRFLISPKAEEPPKRGE